MPVWPRASVANSMEFDYEAHDMTRRLEFLAGCVCSPVKLPMTRKHAFSCRLDAFFTLLSLMPSSLASPRSETAADLLKRVSSRPLVTGLDFIDRHAPRRRLRSALSLKDT